MNRLSAEKRAEILDDMVESKSLRAISRTRKGNARRSSTDPRNKTVALNTVYKLLADVGDTAIDFLDMRLRDLPCTRIEADEAYAWVRMNPIKVRRRAITDPELGVFWIWVALDPASKLVVHWHIGGRGNPDGKLFIDGLANRLANRIQLTTDSLPSYRRAVEKRFGMNIDYATVKKRDAEEERLREEMGDHAYRRLRRKGRVEVESSPPEVIVGMPDLRLATTNHIESFFQKFRQNLRRMVRKTTGYSKTVAHLMRAVALYIFHYNFCRVHSSIGTTPAIAAGIEDSRWTWEDFLPLVDEFTASKGRKTTRANPTSPPAKSSPPSPSLLSSSTWPSADAQTGSEVRFLVYLGPAGDYAKVHKETCWHARYNADDPIGAARFRVCEAIEEAMALANQLAPGHAEGCKVCIDEYHVLGYRDPGRKPRPPRIR